MLKIAYAGMKGRKKDTFLMGFVIVLSFIFVITSTTLYSSSEATKYLDKVEKYGTWRTVSNTTYHPTDTPIEQNAYYAVNILGNSQAGKVATLPSGFQEMAHFQLIDGRLPTAADEIVIEYSQVSQFPRGVKIGDTIPLRLSFMIDQKNVYQAERDSFVKYFDQHMGEIYQFANDNPTHEINNILKDYKKFFLQNRLQYYFDTTAEINLDEVDPIYNADINSDFIQTSLKYDLYYAYCLTQEYNRFSSKILNEISVEELDSIKYTFFAPNQFDFDIKTPQPGVKFNSALTESEMLERGVVAEREVVITLPVKVTGFIDNYSETWYGNNQYPNAYVTPEAGEKIFAAFYSADTFDTSTFRHDSLLFSSLDEQTVTSQLSLDGLVQTNEFMYPKMEAPSEKTYTFGILALIVVATIAAVFQINLTQMKRRTRKIILLKSIGAVKSQIRKLLISEVIIYFLFSIPIGLTVGLFGSWTIIQGLRHFLNIHLVFSINYLMLFFGIILSIVTVIIGMAIPFIKALKVPLTGSMNPLQRKVNKKVYVKPKPKSSPSKRLTFRYISIAHIKRDQKKHTLTFVLNAITIITLLITVVLSYIAYIPYIDEVVINNAPDFSIEMAHGLSIRDREALLKEINTIQGIKSTEVVQYGEQAYLYHENLFNAPPYINNPVIPSFKSFVNITKENDYLIKKARFATCFGIDENGIIMDKLMKSGAATTLNMDKFKSGEEVILLLPAYSDSDSSLSYMKKGLYNTKYAISVGDSFNLTIPTENRTETDFINDVAFHELKVGAIVNRIDGEGVWDFSKLENTPIVITTYINLSKLYSKVITSPNLDFEQMQYLVQYFEPTKNGHTHYQIYADKGENLLEMEIALTRLSDKYHVKPIRHFVTNELVFNKSLKLVMIIIVLGVSIALISLMILYNTTLSKIESERERIGTLQSLGVTHVQFKTLYTATGFILGFVALSVGFILGTFVLIILSGGINALFQSDFATIWLFPWKLFMSISSGFLALCVLTYYLPIKKTLNIAPIHNISGLQK